MYHSAVLLNDKIVMELLSARTRPRDSWHRFNVHCHVKTIKNDSGEFHY